MSLVKGRFFFFILTILPEFTFIYRCLQAVFLFLFLYCQSEAYTTHIGPSDKSLFPYKDRCVKSTPHSRPLFHKEDTTGKYQFVNFSGNIC